MTVALQRELTGALRARPEVVLALLYGSAADSRLRPDSDVDVAVSAGRALTPDERLEIHQDLCRGCRREVDLVDLETTGGPILHEICTTGVVLVKRQPAVFGALIVRMLDYHTDMMPAIRRIWQQRRERLST